MTRRAPARSASPDQPPGALHPSSPGIGIPGPSRPNTNSYRYFYIPIAALFVGFFALLTSCNHNTAHDQTTLTLTIITPHGSDIRREFADAFSAWHAQHFGTPVAIEWPDIGGGGTGNIIKYMDAAYAHNTSSGIDIVFGGGSAAFNSYSNNGYLVPVPRPADHALWPSDPIAAVPADIFNSPLHGKSNLWTAATMSAFGMVANTDRIAELHLPTPKKWEDIATPEWFGRLSLADPSKSGSVKTSYEMILQQYGWERGWKILTELFANAAMIRDNGGAPGEDVSSADAIAGICIDFYGRLAAVRAGPKIVAFIQPDGGTTLDADPIALLKGAPHADLAADFIRFVVSPEGQKLWTLKPGTPGGPRKSALGRLSVLPSLYKEDAANLFDPANPWDAGNSPPLKFNADASRTRSGYLGDLIKAALIDNHDALVRARRAIKTAGDPPDLLAKLEALPTFQPATVSGDSITFADAIPLTEAQQKTLSTEFSPPKDDPRAAQQEFIANTLRDFWRDTFAQRFSQIEHPHP